MPITTSSRRAGRQNRSCGGICIYTNVPSEEALPNALGTRRCSRIDVPKVTIGLDLGINISTQRIVMPHRNPLRPGPGHL